MLIVVQLVFFFMTSNNISEGRIVPAIIGRNVSFTFTLTTKDAIKIFHGTSRFLTVWSDAEYYLVPEKSDKMRVLVNVTENDTIIVYINLLNITKDDAGIYMVAKQFDSKEFNDSVDLRTIEVSMIPRIDVVREMTLDSSLRLQCKHNTSSIFARNFLWKLNASLIQTQDRHYVSNDSLSIRNVTAGDQHNIYTCMEQRNELESDPFKIKLSGPNAITFTPNVTVVFEYDSFNVSCNSECGPVCAWQWTEIDPMSGLETFVSSETVVQINNITRQNTGKYLCKVRNILSGSTLTNYLSLDVIYTSYYVTTTPQVDDMEASVTGNYLITGKSREDDTEASGFPPKHLLMYLFVGFGVLLAIVFFSCLMQKFQKCLRMERVVNTIPLEDNGEEITPEENPTESYWTIVSNARGELSTAVETNARLITQPTSIYNKAFSEVNQLETSAEFYRREVDMELDGYIHPISSNISNTGFSSRRHTTEV